MFSCHVVQTFVTGQLETGCVKTNSQCSRSIKWSSAVHSGSCSFNLLSKKGNTTTLFLYLCSTSFKSICIFSLMKEPFQQWNHWKINCWHLRLWNNWKPQLFDLSSARTCRKVGPELPSRVLPLQEVHLAHHPDGGRLRQRGEGEEKAGAPCKLWEQWFLLRRRRSSSGLEETLTHASTHTAGTHTDALLTSQWLENILKPAGVKCLFMIFKLLWKQPVWFLLVSKLIVNLRKFLFI